MCRNRKFVTEQMGHESNCLVTLVERFRLCGTSDIPPRTMRSAWVMGSWDGVAIKRSVRGKNYSRYQSLAELKSRAQPILQ